MGIERRLTRLEQTMGTADSPIRIFVLRCPGELPPDQVEAWLAEHRDEATSKIIEVVDGISRVVYEQAE